DERLLRGDSGLGLFEARHDSQLRVLEIAHPSGQARELVLERLCVLRVGRGRETVGVTGATLLGYADVGLETGELGADVVARTGQHGQITQLLLARLGELVDPGPLRGRRPTMLGLLQAPIEVGHVEKDALVLGAGVHMTNLPATVDARQTPR